MRHRPIGIGVQGLADCFQMLKMSFDSPEARKLNKQIFETIYFGACSASCELAQVDGAYQTFEGSPASQGKLQFEFHDSTWKVKLTYYQVGTVCFCTCTLRCVVTL